MSVYNYSVKTMDGKEISMEKFQGKVLLILNSATHCGFTIQYTGLQELYSKYKDEGFEILDFPCNQFGEQAPGSNEEIHEFCVTLNNTERSSESFDTCFSCASKNEKIKAKNSININQNFIRLEMISGSLELENCIKTVEVKEAKHDYIIA